MSAGLQSLAPEVERVFAIGDVHGRADLLAPLLGHIEAVAPNERTTAIVFLGDLVDRGPDSRGVVDLVLGAFKRFPRSKLCLGNHDDWLRRFVDGDPTMAEDLDPWLEQGGAETLQSYASLDRQMPEIRAAILASPGHTELLREAAQLVLWRDFVFVHAGVDPAVSLAEQSEHTSLWIRSPFLRHVGPIEAVVVHGHTPQKPPRPHVTENRISLDTGAVFSHVLTAADFDAAAATLRFLSSGHDGVVRTVEPMPEDRGAGTLLDPIAPSGGPALFRWPDKKGAARRPPNLAGVSGHEKPDPL